MKKILNIIKSTLISLIIALSFRWALAENFRVSGTSMEKTILDGDVMLISKIHYGPRLTMTPLQIPLTHQKIFNKTSFSNSVKFPYLRFPGISKIKRGDVIIMNDPNQTEYPIDLRRYLVKRCIGVPGDTLKINNGDIFVNKSKFINPSTVLFLYEVNSTKNLNIDFFKKFNIKNHYSINSKTLLITTPYIAKKISKEPNIKYIKKMIRKKAFDKCLGNLSKNWSVDNLGPIMVPKKNLVIDINRNTLSIYGDTMINHENADIEIKSSKLYISNKQVDKYKFKQNYYFVVGDNRPNSLDSRYIGFIPETHIVGKGFIVVYSLDKSGKFLNKIRWNRFFKTNL